MNTELNLKTLIVKKPLKLDCGKTINDFPIAYETYGTLNKQKDNAILVFHALTGDQFVTGLNPITNKGGWWSYAVGPATLETSIRTVWTSGAKINEPLMTEPAPSNFIAVTWKSGPARPEVSAASANGKAN